MPDTLLDFTKVCRCCLLTAEEMVFLDPSSQNVEGSLSNMITTCTVTKVCIIFHKLFFF